MEKRRKPVRKTPAVRLTKAAEHLVADLGDLRWAAPGIIRSSVAGADLDLGCMGIGASVNSELGFLVASAGQLGAERLQLALRRMRRAPGFIREALAEEPEISAIAAFS